jgi:hypothetical protein
MSVENSIIGVKEIKMGACGTNGTMGTTLTAIGDIIPDSALIAFDEPGKTDLFVDEVDTTWYTIPDYAVPRRMEFSSRDLSPTTLVKGFGGTAINSTRWEAPVLLSAIEQSLTIESKPANGFKRIAYIPKGLVRASLDAKLQKKDSGAIKFVVDIITPFNSGGTALPAFYIDKVAG